MTNKITYTKQGAQRVPFLLVKRIGNRRRALRKQSGGLFSARAQMTLCRCSRPGKRRRWGPLKLTHIIRSKKGHPREALRKEVASLWLL